MDRITKLLGLLQAEPEDSFLRHALALEYIKDGNELHAKSEFERLLANDPSYVGSYYHLAKLYERIGEEQKAIITYENGMSMALQQNNKHALGELRSAYEELTM